MSNSNRSGLDLAFAISIGHEGAAYDRTYGDPGNWTGGLVGNGTLLGSKYGISANTYPNLDIANLTQADAEAIYERDYWAPLLCDQMPVPVACIVFDAGLNNGIGRASRWLQGALGVTVDGIIGPETLGALAAAQPAALIASFMALRWEFMAGLNTWPRFGLGWSRRLSALPLQAVGLMPPLALF